MIHVRSPRDIPKGPHFVIMTFNTLTIHHEGDERSQQSPGHGYPEHDEQILEIIYQVTEDEAEWQKELQKIFRRDPRRTDVSAFKVNGMAKVSHQVNIEVDSVKA